MQVTCADTNLANFAPHLVLRQVVILDEAHERTVQTDVLMGLLKKMKVGCTEFVLTGTSHTESMQP